MIGRALESGVEIKLTSDPEFVEAFSEEVARSDGFDVRSQGPETDPGDLGFDLGAIASIVGVAVDLLGKVVPPLVAAIRRTKPRKIVIATPFGTTIYEPSENLTEDEVREVLRKLVEL